MTNDIIHVMNNIVNDRFATKENTAPASVSDADIRRRFLNYDDPFAGFKAAVNNNQTLLALEHAVLVFETLRSVEEDDNPENVEIARLTEELEKVKQELATLKASLAPSRKTSKSPSTKPEPQPEAQEDKAE